MFIKDKNADKFRIDGHPHNISPASNTEPL